MFRQSMVKEILSYDPLISDNACQNRAVALLALARKVKKGKVLSEDEISFLDACSLLTLTKTVTRNEFGSIENETTDNKKIPPMFFNDADNVSNNTRNKIIAVKKKEVAEMAVKILKRKSPLLLDESMAYFDRSSAEIKLCSESIPVLPVYISAKMLLQYINRKKIPVLINLKRIRKDGETLTKDGEINLCYQGGKIQSADNMALSEKNDNGVILFEMISTYMSKVRPRSKLFTEDDFNQFTESFKQQEFNLLIMLCAVAHDAYQKSIITNENDPMASPVSPIFKPMGKLSLKECSMTEYRELIGMASQYGFFKKRLSVDHISVLSGSDCRQKIKGIQ